MSKTLRQLRQDLLLALTQRPRVRQHGLGLAEVDEVAAFAHRADCEQQLTIGCFLRHVSESAGRQQRAAVRWVVVHREHEDAGVRAIVPNFPEGFEPG